jgi:hypothetical protein
VREHQALGRRREIVRIHSPLLLRFGGQAGRAADWSHAGPPLVARTGSAEV